MNDVKNYFDHAFMGFTHSLSVVAILLGLLAFNPSVVYNWLGTNSIPVVALFILCSVGAGVFPDLDNSTSSAKSRLGLFGAVLSFFFRESARLIMTFVRKKGDDPTPDPHRGFWHTIEAAGLLGFIAWMLTTIESTVTIPYLGELTLGLVFSYLIASTLVYLGFATLWKRFFEKNAKKFVLSADLLAFVSSFVVVSLLMQSLPVGYGMQWLGLSLTAGCIIHTLGDTFTKQGVCVSILFNLIFRRKLWWNDRLFMLEANGPTENTIVRGVFAAIIMFSSLSLAFN